MSVAAFDYIALDAGGLPRKGLIRAVDAEAARASLKRRRLAPVRIEPAVQDAGAPKRPLIGPRGLDGKVLSVLTRQLATLIAVTPLEEALRTMSQQADSPRIARALTVVHDGVLEGFRLSEAMGRPGAGFPPLYRAMVAAGENSGALPDILERLADLYEQQQQVAAKVTAALVYPIVLAVTAILVVIALMTFVVPKVVDQFDSMGQALPLLTRVVMGISAFLSNHGLVLLAVIAVLVLLFMQGLRRPAFRRGVDGALLRAPVIGRLIRDVQAARLARTLATMIAAGVPVLQGLEMTARTVRNTVMREAMTTMADSIREGGGLSAAMRRVGVFPPILVYMTASGESSARLDMMLGRAADYLEREFNTFTTAALSLLEPAIIVVMGGVVATIVLSILLPILQLNSLALG
jgi:general secretion pathway protein F